MLPGYDQTRITAGVYLQLTLTYIPAHRLSMRGLGYRLALDRALLTNLLAFCLSPLASELSQLTPETFLPTNL